MITPWRRAVVYAVPVTLPSWLWGVAVLNVGVLAGGPSAADLGPDMTVGGGLLFVPVAVLVLTLVRRTLPALSRWRTATIDVSVYAVLCLLCVVATLLAAGSGAADAVDRAFVMMTAALLDLQFLPALALCARRYDRLVPRAPANRLPHGPHTA
ncbi:hypothetical protein [Streptomyces sp. NPDC002324]